MASITDVTLGTNELQRHEVTSPGSHVTKQVNLSTVDLELIALVVSDYFHFTGQVSHTYC